MQLKKYMEINRHNIVNYLLEEADFLSFSFDCNFSLIFGCKQKNNIKLPFSVRLAIEGDWWFGDKNTWMKIVEEKTAHGNYIEPEEPVLAFKLAALRWSAGSAIRKIKLSKNKLLILFYSGDSISILNHADYDCEITWEIVECEFDIKVPNNYWWVSCDTLGNINYNIPAASRLSV